MAQSPNFITPLPALADSAIEREYRDAPMRPSAAPLKPVSVNQA